MKWASLVETLAGYMLGGPNLAFSLARVGLAWGLVFGEVAPWHRHQHRQLQRRLGRNNRVPAARDRRLAGSLRLLEYIDGDIKAVEQDILRLLQALAGYNDRNTLTEGAPCR